MQKHHFYMALGIALAAFGGAVGYFVPPLAGLHGAGLGLAIAGAIDRWYSRGEPAP